MEPQQSPVSTLYPMGAVGQTFWLSQWTGHEIETLNEANPDHNPIYLRIGSNYKMKKILNHIPKEGKTSDYIGSQKSIRKDSWKYPLEAQENNANHQYNPPSPWIKDLLKNQKSLRRRDRKDHTEENPHRHSESI